MIRYLITDGTSASDEARWLEHLKGWMEREIDFVQVREPQRTIRDLATLTKKLLSFRGRATTKILVNDRIDLAVACKADGVHLRDHSVGQPILAAAAFPDGLKLIISRACHDPSQAAQPTDLIILAPIFAPLSKSESQPPLGVRAIAQAKRLTSTPIIALGGITRANQQSCIEAGASGIAGITCFQTHDGA